MSPQTHACAEVPGPAASSLSAQHTLREVIERAARLLPLQGPIDRYWHHNILHAFEHLPFHEALAQASEVYGARDALEPSEALAAFRRGRITLRDVDAALAAETMRSSDAPVAYPTMEIHRDRLLERTGLDIHELVHALLIRTCSAYLDRGVAYWPMPDRARGLYAAFVWLYTDPLRVEPLLLRGLRDSLRQQRAANLSAIDVVSSELQALGVETRDHEAFVVRMLMSLRGWAGMVRRLELNPADAPETVRPTLIDYLAVRLTLERVAVQSATRHAFGRAIPAPEVLRWPPVPDARRAHAELEVEAHDRAAAAALHPKLAALDGRARRRVWHEAYEHALQRPVLDALAVTVQRPRQTSRTPTLQVLLCIDAREESFRRHIEEQSADHVTYGLAGFFGLPMRYRGIDDGRHVDLCPIVVKPEHVIEEIAVHDARPRSSRRRLWARMLHLTHTATRSLSRAALLTPLLGALAAMPLVLRVLLPRSAWRIRHWMASTLAPTVVTRLGAEPGDYASQPASDGPAPSRGLSLELQARLVATQLENMGLRGPFAPIVLLFGHGASAVNNPHKSAYDCGACNGNSGAANARLFAHIANQPAVRALLRARGIDITEHTWFVGAFHDTTKDAVRYFDVDVIPAAMHGAFEQARAVIETARRLNAHERARRFDSAPRHCTPDDALRHVEARAEDLAQARPEFGNATNAVCVVGRRDLTRGLFLDRRAFLVSHDPSVDTDHAILERILAAVVPVCAGINLQYFFSALDNEHYGAGSKLPHNLTGLLGVMDGPASDLRTGLPLQGVEVHEPVRLLLIVEASPDALLAVCERHRELKQLVFQRWLHLVSVEPTTRAIHVFNGARFIPHVAETDRLPHADTSRAWYAGKHGFWDFLPPAIIDGNHVTTHGARHTGSTHA